MRKMSWVVWANRSGPSVGVQVKETAENEQTMQLKVRPMQEEDAVSAVHMELGSRSRARREAV